MTNERGMPHTPEDLNTLLHQQLTRDAPTARLQAQMRRDERGHLVCD